MLFYRKMVRVAVSLGLVAICGGAVGQLDIAGHKELLKKQEIPKLEVKTEKSFQVFEAVNDEHRKSNSSSHASTNGKALVTVNKTPDNETSSLNDEMVSYSTKVSVSMKTDNHGQQIDRTSYFVPPGADNFIQHPPAPLQSF